MDSLTRLLRSSVWDQDDATRLIWITLLGMTDRYGDVIATLNSIAILSREPVPETEEALRKFCEEGLLEIIPGGWKIVNWKKL